MLLSLYMLPLMLKQFFYLKNKRKMLNMIIYNFQSVCFAFLPNKFSLFSAILYKLINSFFQDSHASVCNKKYHFCINKTASNLLKKICMRI